MKLALAVASLLAFAAPLGAAADDSTLKFDGGIGVIPVSNVNPSGVATPNVVQGVSPGGQPWVIAKLTAKVRSDGRISVEGRGLLLAGGNGIGTTGNQSVEAALFCGGFRHDTGVVPLDPDGGFRIEDVLTPVPPSPCASPVLLIVSAGGRWFAAGIPEQER
jgi:hypothetical protein